jgi:molybdenum cofactor cytidylyltransferase
MSAGFRCGLVLLAAGGSRRMSQPKQLLPVSGQPLVRYVAEQALRAAVAPVVVVLGAEAERIAPLLAGLAIEIAVNPQWAEGQGASLRVGVAAALAAAGELDALIVALADQPSLPPGHLDALAAAFRAGGCSIVASQVGGERVAPMLFGAQHFVRLQRFTGDTGARMLVREFGQETAVVPLATNADLDTPEDYARFQQGEG